MVNKFLVTPMSQKISLKAGETYEGLITVANPAASTEDFYFRVSVSPYSVSGENYVQDFSTKSDWSRIVEWITLDADGGKLAPNETTKIGFKVKVPKDAPGGGQYAAIAITSNNPAKENQNGTIQNIYEMASLIFADIDGETKHEGKVLEHQIPGFVASGKPTVVTKLSNEGTVHEIAKIKISVKNNITGEIVSPGENDQGAVEAIIMPQSIRMFSQEISNLPALGVFEVSESISYLNDEINVSNIMIVCPIWFIVLVFATIVSLISMVFYGRHLRHKKIKKINKENSDI